MMGKLRKTKGITLIALVITIIVLLILAGVTISTLTGENGILTRAQMAKEDTEKATAEERIQTEIMGSYDNTGKIELNVLNNNLKNNIPELIYKGKVLSETNKITNLPATVVLDTYKIQISEDGEVREIKTVAEITDYVTKNTLVEDEYGNLLIVPEDFKIRVDNTTNNADTVNNGIVIEDRKGNQFVWIPLGEVKTDNAGTTVNITLNRYDFDDYTEDTIENHDSSYENAIAKNIADFINHSNSNNGYYIGRYEAGIVNYNAQNIITENTNKEVNWTGYSPEEGKKLELVCKSGVQPWNYVTQNKASELARNMYTGKNYESDLINSYAWDTAISYIQMCGMKTNSKSYSSQDGQFIDTSKPSMTGKGILNSTNTVDEQCNIYDMAGNETEWSTETSNLNSTPCVDRGGMYYWDERSANVRGMNSNTLVYDYISFRPVLYF